MDDNVGLESKNTWDFWIDRGGTFTDIVAKNNENQLFTKKLLSENPEAYEDAALQGIREFLEVNTSETIPFDRIGSIKMGTTVATNALLERKGERTLLLITEGLRDVLEIGFQVRPKTFALEIEKPEVLYSDVIEVSERVDSNGKVLRSLDEAAVKTTLEEGLIAGYRSVAIVLMHAYRFPDHEKRVAQIAAKLGFEQVSASHEVSPMIRIVPRGDTTVVDAYLSPLLRRYVDLVAAAVGAKDNTNRLQFMRSSGGLTAANKFHGRDAILSGPAGGIVGAVHTSKLAGFDRIIGFDMGGTSTDVSHYAGAYERAFETEVAGVRMSVPMMSVHTVAAGGGSVLHYDERRFRVGPESAGAHPGPKCYRRGGPLTVTDANVCLGKISPEFFPKLFGSNHDQTIDVDGVNKAFDDLAVQQGMSAEQVAEGFLKIAVEHMAQAIKKISIERGYDVQNYALCCFGGAGGQHACLVAERLGMQTIFIHPFASILSAYGMGLADLRTQRTESFRVTMAAPAATKLAEAFDRLRSVTSSDLFEQGVAYAQQHHEATAFLRYQGTDTALPVEYADFASMKDAFEAAHHAQYGFVSEGKEIIVESISMESFGGGELPDEPELELSESPLPAAQTRSRVFSGGKWQDAPIFQLASLEPGHRLDGPAIIIEPNGTVVVEPGWSAQITARKHLVLNKVAHVTADRAEIDDHDPVMVEIFNNLFMSIAEQMGIVLRNTSSSVNIKERLDFSCAVFDSSGDLIANAPHIPVHLGSMDASVKIVISSDLTMERGDVFIHNDPFNGGSHLPDVTVITPVFDELENTVLFFVASRAHHADIGGTAPGSMSPSAVTIDEEGVIITCMKLVARGEFLEEELRRVLLGGPYPVRNVEQNIADLQAQIGANRRGENEIRKLIAEYGIRTVNTYTNHVMDNAEESVRNTIQSLSNSNFEYLMDDGLRIRVAITVDKAARTATIDFTGTSEQQPNNFNAPAAITQAVVLYVFRCLVDSDIPLNAGCMRPLKIIVPKGSMLHPSYPAAVVAGNVEISQAVANTLFGALGSLGSSQGTMNNLTFGNDQYQYYETICSGAPAGPGFNGTAAVHTHMTNSRLTDPEILETRYPVLLSKFVVRRGSGGKGQWNAGDGVDRRITFHEDMECAILSGHRSVPPFGTNGGCPGQVGKNWVDTHDGESYDLLGCDETVVHRGDTIVIQTPTGGGFGAGGEQCRARDGEASSG